MQRARILIVEDDRPIQQLLSLGLSQSHEIATASDGAEGLALARSFRPSLILLDVMMPTMSGWSVVRQLRASAEFAFVPVIFLTSLGQPVHRMRAFRLGADDFLTKPVHLPELEQRIQRALERSAALRASFLARTEASAPSQPSGLSGTLDQLGLSSLLTMLEMEHKSGVLRVLPVVGQTAAQVYLREGKIVHARIFDKPIRKNLDAVFELLTWTDGRFEFLPCKVDLPDEVNASMTFLLLEAARRLDDEQAEGEAYLQDEISG